jgi:menaquinone-9 beta-reductase
MVAPRNVEVVGSGPAGAVAALAALAEGSAVTIYEQARLPRHKVCGEFLSPEVACTLTALGLWPVFTAAKPASITRAALHLGGREKRFVLPEPAYGLSRRSLDQLLLGEALRRGAVLVPERRASVPTADAALVVAHGRSTADPPRTRLYGFKTHYRRADLGVPDDTVELHFFGNGYAGVSPVEGGEVNVCGLLPEADLRARGFQPDALLPELLRARLGGLQRCFPWLLTGPLVFRSRFRSDAGVYMAGDALGFVDPFTGSGILAAMLTGRLAGAAASRGVGTPGYYAECRTTLRRQYRVASAIRSLLGTRLSVSLMRWIPGSLLYRLTRPQV